MAGKKDEAEVLFAQGFAPGSAEVDELGLAKSTLKKYHAGWKAKQPNEEAANAAGFTVKIVPTPTLGSLAPRQLFNYNGAEYRVNILGRDKVHVLLVEDHPSGVYKVETQGRYLPADTKVIPKL